MDRQFDTAKSELLYHFHGIFPLPKLSKLSPFFSEREVGKHEDRKKSDPFTVGPFKSGNAHLFHIPVESSSCAIQELVKSDRKEKSHGLDEQDPRFISRFI